MAKQVTVLKAPLGSTYSLPTTALYGVGNVVTLSEVSYANLPASYLAGGYVSSPTTVSDTTPAPGTTEGDVYLTAPGGRTWRVSVDDNGRLQTNT